MEFSTIFYKEFDSFNGSMPATLYNIYLMRILVKIDNFFTKIGNFFQKNWLFLLRMSLKLEISNLV